MPTSVRSWPGFGARRAGEIDAVGRDGLEQQALRAQARRHRGDAAQRRAGHPERRLLRADVAAVDARARAAARPCAGRPPAASARRRMPCPRCTLRRAAGESARCVEVQHPAPQRGARAAARARLQHEHGRQRPGRVDGKRHGGTTRTTLRSARRAPRGSRLRRGAGAAARLRSPTAEASWPPVASAARAERAARAPAASAASAHGQQRIRDGDVMSLAIVARARRRPPSSG